jgi:hypothetical protein
VRLRQGSRVLLPYCSLPCRTIFAGPRRVWVPQFSVPTACHILARVYCRALGHGVRVRLFVCSFPIPPFRSNIPEPLTPHLGLRWRPGMLLSYVPSASSLCIPALCLTSCNCLCHHAITGQSNDCVNRQIHCTSEPFKPELEAKSACRISYRLLIHLPKWAGKRWGLRCQ